MDAPTLASHSGLEVDEALVQSPEHMQAQTTSIDLDGQLHPPLLLRQDLQSGCGGQLWPAGLVLARYLLRHPEIVLQDRVVELGCGGGLVGLVVAQNYRGQRRCPIYITDQEPLLPLMRENIGLNSLSAHVNPLVLDWGDSVPDELSSAPIDVILAADCIYFEPAFPLLLQTLCDLSRPSTTVIFCYKKRRRADIRFMKQARKAFLIEEIEDDPERHIYQRENIFLYKMRKK